MFRGSAVVIGGSVAGLITARVLADHFERVTLVERDVFPLEPPDVRQGLPQAHHQHILLVRGRQILELLFPGFDGELAAFGGPLVDYTRDCVLCSAAGRLPRFASGLELRLCRRPLIDWVLRRRLGGCSRVRLLQGQRVARLLAAGDRVGGVVLEPARGEGPSALLQADLVVDAGGRNSRASEWLGLLGFDAPEQQVVNPFLGYASRLYRPPVDGARDWKAVEVASRPPHNPRAAGLWEVEDGRWLLTLIGTARHYPPVDEAGFLAFARDLPDPIVHEALRGAEPLSRIRGFRGMDSRWRHYEALKRFPEGLVVLGDAFCAFNPTHGQGMTVAALGALALGRELRRARWHQGGSLRSLGPKVHRELARLVDPVWKLAVSDDFRWPGTEGAKAGASQRLFQVFQDLIMPLGPRSPALVQAFLSVSNMVKPFSELLRPRLLAHLLRLRFGAGGLDPRRQP